MRIAQLHVYQKNMAVKDGPCTMSGMTVWSVEKTIVRRVSDTWHERWGEVCPLGSLYAPVQASAIRAVMREIGEFLVGVPIGANTVRQAIDSLVNCGGYLHSAFDIATIRSQIRHPLYLDESATDLATAISAIFKGFVEGFGMKLSRLGGHRPFGAFRDVCAAHGLHYTCDDSRCGDIVAAPRVQTAAACEPRCLEGVWLATPRIDDSDLSDTPVTVESGHISLPKGAGLGITPDSDRLGPPVASFGC
ncbi:MAG: hypothetical protein OXE85_01015 [Roseovarius sp.]|nr:hypothetical protein [Roseovarius sp.]